MAASRILEDSTALKVESPDHYCSDIP